MGVLVVAGGLGCSGASPEAGPITDILNAQPTPSDATAEGAAGHDAAMGDAALDHAGGDAQADVADGAPGDGPDALPDALGDAPDGGQPYPDAEEMSAGR